MPELRWTLLIIGVLFIAILAWWERRRPHQASRQSPHISGEPRPIVNNDPSWGPEVDSSGPRATPHALREPTLTLPEIRTEVRSAREPAIPRDLPVVHMPAEPEAEREEALSEELLSEEIDEISEEISRDVAADSAEQLASVRPDVVVAKRASVHEEPDFDDSEIDELGDDLEAEEDADLSSEPTRPVSADVVPTPAVALAETTTTEASKSSELSPTPVAMVRPIVDWPPEDQRKLVSIRLVARPPERFRGSLVRQALYGEGFVLGDLDIFHKPDAQNRAVLSAASLTKPGTFDLGTMDTQRYVGLNLFAVLPGPKTPRKAFEDLLTTARMLNERLEGALQDERGGPLTPMRIQALRDSLETEAKP
jgi:cell division protein ZipA